MTQRLSPREIEIFRGTDLMLGLWSLLQTAAFAGEILDAMSPEARHELVDAFAGTRIAQVYLEATEKLTGDKATLHDALSGAEKTTGKQEETA